MPAHAGITSASHVGSAVCRSCHAEQGRLWQQSHHALSMQPANAKTVLGNFKDARFAQHGQTSRFFQRGGGYWVNTDGPEGQTQDFRVVYAFGVYPLQQYLVELSGGRLQALEIAWDARAREAGGQRWFTLSPEQKVAATDSFHWSGREHNWNFMCSNCHSTGVSRNFDLTRGRYTTRWQEVNVACEACHGPGSKHVALARTGHLRKSVGGLATGFSAGKSVRWQFLTPQQNIASPLGDVAAAKRDEEACYGCHSRRQELVPKAAPGGAFLDNYLPRLLEADVYHADGQIKDEVFEYGSFMQSRMHRAGVGCTNCHEAHSLKLRAGGNALCAQCHRASHYDQPSHHRHPPASPGAQCVNCHMPGKTYMGVHFRRDHSLRVPRPDLSEATGAPNACNQCHMDKSPKWAAEAVVRWRGRPVEPEHFAPELAATWAGEGVPGPLALAEWQSGFVRGSALALLPPAPASAAPIRRAAEDSDGLVRLGAARALVNLAPGVAKEVGSRLLVDPLRAVRIEAARALAGMPDSTWPAGLRRRFAAALDELIAAELSSAERPESHLNLAQVYGRLGRLPEAERSLQTALRLAPGFVPALVNQADLLRATGRDGEAEAPLRLAVQQPVAAPNHALGLWLIRHARLGEALPWLEKAAALDELNGQYARIYALALAESGATDKAVDFLVKAREKLPRDRELLQTQIALEKRLGRPGGTRTHADH